MKVIWHYIGDHLIRFECLDDRSAGYLHQMFGDRPAPVTEPVDPPDLYQITVRHGGAPNHGVDTVVSQYGTGAWLFERPDYRLALSSDYRRANIQFYNYIGLRSVMMNWYGAVLAHLGWGLVVHSSCVIHEGAAYLFAGMSGAGKTTVAELSHPRGLLSDEAAIVNIRPDGQVWVYDSPMRSSLFTPAPVGKAPLKAVYLLQQSPMIRTRQLSPVDALLSLFEKIWYWRHEDEAAARVVRMCAKLVQSVPVYELEFQKNDQFWEAIS